MTMSKLPALFFNLKNRHFFLIDTVLFFFLPIVAFAIRMDGRVDLNEYGLGLLAVMIIFPLIKLTIFYFSGMYQRYWRYASIDEVAYIGMVTAFAVIVQTLIFILFYNLNVFHIITVPRSIPIIDGFLSFILVGGTRLSVRLVERLSERSNLKKGNRVIVIGAGKSGVSLVGEMQRYPEHGLNPVAFIDDDPKKQHLHIRGLTVVGDRSKIPAAVRLYKADKVIIAMPTASGKDIRELLEICKRSDVKVSTLPSIFEIINGKVRLESVRDIHIEDLLRREPVRTDIQKVAEMIKGNGCSLPVPADRSEARCADRSPHLIRRKLSFSDTARIQSLRFNRNYAEISTSSRIKVKSPNNFLQLRLTLPIFVRRQG
jgi:FlaA1/EpsC-like NDP-sugar epimerase